MKKALILVPLIVLFAAGCSSSSNSNNNNNSQSSGSPTSQTQGEPTPTTTQAAGQVKEFTVTAQNYSFDPKEIRVKQGDTVKITFKNNEGFHDWTLDEFNVKTPTIPKGETATVEFVADKTGTFEYYCAVGNHKQMGMKGNLIVEQ